MMPCAMRNGISYGWNLKPRRPMPRLIGSDRHDIMTIALNQAQEVCDGKSRMRFHQSGPSPELIQPTQEPLQSIAAFGGDHILNPTNRQQDLGPSYSRIEQP